jgi:hypothetical protein
MFYNGTPNFLAKARRMNLKEALTFDIKIFLFFNIRRVKINRNLQKSGEVQNFDHVDAKRIS